MSEAAVANAGSRRRDIEGLRFIAAILVAVYHLWLGRVSGGVDVFFTVSGFLITLTLLGHLRDHERPRPLHYLGRLLRRLLPAAATVLLAVLIVRAFIVPPLLPSIPEIVASAFYFENWQLAFSSIDYLAADDPHTAVQHFWAMSVQGQFYLIWLALFLLVWLTIRLAGRRSPGVRAILMWYLVVSFAVSLTFSVILTAADQAFTYFNTFARVWEFALGGIVAVILPQLALPRWLRAILGWIGLAAVVVCGLVLNVSSMFPGFAALWPTLGAAFVLVSGGGRGAAANPVLSWRPLAWMGGLSYGIYLWHWPLLTFARDLLRRNEVGPTVGVVIIGGAIALAWLTRVLVERPLLALPRRIGSAQVGPALATALPVVLVLAIVTSALSVSAEASRTDAAGRELLQRVLTGGEVYCLGAAIHDPSGCTPLPPDLDRVFPVDPRKDNPAVYSDGCRTFGGEPAHLCRYGDPDGDVSILLIGNSHTATWFPAFESIATKNGWRLDMFFETGCTLTAAPKTPGSTDTACSRFYDDVMSQVAARPPYDLVVSTYRSNNVFWRDADGRVDDDIAVRGFRAAWDPLIARGSTVLVIQDVPHVRSDQIRCRDRDQRYGPGDCALPRAEAVGPDLMVRAATGYPGTAVIDMNDWFCTATTCPATVGNVKVYQDMSSHVTQSFILTTTPYLEAELRSVLARRDEG